MFTLVAMFISITLVGQRREITLVGQRREFNHDEVGHLHAPTITQLPRFGVRVPASPRFRTCGRPAYPRVSFVGTGETVGPRVGHGPALNLARNPSRHPHLMIPPDQDMDRYWFLPPDLEHVQWMVICI